LLSYLKIVYTYGIGAKCRNMHVTGMTSNNKIGQIR
jgi:hypothetical protein